MKIISFLKLINHKMVNNALLFVKTLPHKMLFHYFLDIHLNTYIASHRKQFLICNHSST